MSSAGVRYPHWADSRTTSTIPFCGGGRAARVSSTGSAAAGSKPLLGIATGSEKTSDAGSMRESMMRALRRCNPTDMLRRRWFPAAITFSLARFAPAFAISRNASWERSPQRPKTSTTIGTKSSPAFLHSAPNLSSLTAISYCSAAAPPHTPAH